MAINRGKRISELTELTSASLNTTLVGVDGGTTYKIELDTLADAVTARVNILDRDRLLSLESVTSSFEIKGRSVISSSAQITSFGFVSNSIDISSLNSFTSSQSSLNTAFTNGISARLQTSSFNEYTASQSTSSLVNRLNAIESVTGSFLTSLSGAISSSSQLTSSYDTRYTLSGSVQPLPSNLLSSSAQITAFGFISSSTTIDTGSFNSIGFNTSAGVSVGVGELAWNNTDGTLDLGMKGGNVVQQIGQEIFYEVRNETGIQIPNGTAVYANGVTAGSGRITAAPYVADGSIREVRFLGIATENITSGVNGFITHFGYVRDLDTRGTTASSIAVGDETWSVGDILYVHPTIAGKLTKVKPQHEVTAAIIITRHQSSGVIFVRPSSAGHLEDIHDILINTGSLSNGQVLSYNSTSGVWENTNTISGSSQLTASFDTRYILSGSVQPLPSNLVSSSAQITAFGFISSSTTINTSSFATTGSNSFSGSQTITGSLIVSAVAVVAGALTIPSASVISLTSGSSISVDASGAITGSLTGSVFGIGDVVSFSASLNSRIISGSSVAGTISGSSQIAALGYATTSSLNTLSSSVDSRFDTLEGTIISGSPNYTQVLGNKRTGIESVGTSIISGSITTTGNPVQIMVTGDANPIGGSGWARLQIFRDGNGIGNIIQVENSSNLNVPYCLNVIDTPSAGTYTYSMRTVDGMSGTFDFGESTGPLLTAVELNSKTSFPSGTISGSSQLTSSFDTRYAISASFVSSSNLSSIQTITSASYAALTPVSGTLYIIIG
jgi:hypothetical protein